ncbi:MAG: LD-carboxypeptidase [Armatimonadetes bacterium]|nr:LD-carboxypeptidase [Armatimonadota bacterium]
MLKPAALKPGDQVRVVTPASPLDDSQIADGVALLESEGYRVTLAPRVFDRDGYLAGPDEGRADDLMAAFEDANVACVMCSRGGYGSARLFPFLDLDVMAKSGKMFCGFSDVTTLHLALNRRGLVTMHTPMLITLSVERESWVIESFKNLLRGHAAAPKGTKKADTLVTGTAEGPLTGGCLCLLTDSLATPDALDAEGKILLIEDVGADPHRVDAMLTHLINAGVLQSAAGIAFGEMTRTDEIGEEKGDVWPWRKIVQDRVAPLGIPAVIDFPFGHMKTMLSVPMGVRARLDADAGTLEIIERPCN